LATVYRATGRLAAADPLLERVVALEETVVNVEDLAKIKVALPNLRRAEELYRRSLSLRRQSGEDEVNRIVTHQRLAQILIAGGNYAEAEAEAVTAMTIRSRSRTGQSRSGWVTFPSPRAFIRSKEIRGGRRQLGNRGPTGGAFGSTI
jgi:hypothetical protein